MAVASLMPSDRKLPLQLEVADRPAHHGGEGSVYPTTDGAYVVKVYHSPGPDKRRLLQQIIRLGLTLGADERFLAWPLAIVSALDDRPCTGVVTRQAPASFSPLYKVMYSPVEAAEQFRGGRSWLDYLKTARAVTSAVGTIHDRGMAHADVHLKNVLGELASGAVVLIDLDGLVVKGFLPPQVKGMPGFIAPEVVTGTGESGELADRYSTAVLVLWTLLLRNVMAPQQCHDETDPVRDDELGYGHYACFSEHPRDRSNWLPRIGTPLFRGGLLSYRALTPRLQELTIRALVQGLHDPVRRPTLREWEQALAEAYDVLVGCPDCRQSWFHAYWLHPRPRRQCPFCGAAIRAPFPAVLELSEETAEGDVVSVRPLVLYSRLPLFADVVEPGRIPPFTRQGVPVVGETHWDPVVGVHRLCNLSDSPWQLIGGGAGSVGRGESLALQAGTTFRLGSSRRILRVVE